MIKIKRLSDAVDYQVPYRVLIDQRPVMEIMNDTLKNYEVPEGEHTIQIVSQDYVSEEVKFHNYEGQIIEFECKPDHKENQASKLFHKLFLGKVGITLTKKNDFYL